METEREEGAPPQFDPSSALVEVVSTTTSDVPTRPELRRAHRARSFTPAFVLTVSAVGTVAVVGLVFLLYAAGIHAAVGISDGASVVLQGQAIGNGHVLLHGWALSYDSFWTVDAPMYALAYLIVGVTPSLLFAVPAAMAAAVIVVGVMMVCEDRRGAAAAAGGLTVIAILAFPTHAMAEFFLRGPFHVATALYALLAFAGLRRGRFGWGWVLAVIFLTLAILGDLQILFYGVAPVFVAGIVAMMRERTWRGGAAASSAAVVAGVLAVVLRKIAEHFGAFSIGPANPHASLHVMLTNIKLVVSNTLELIGARSVRYGTGGVPGGLQLVHVVEAALLTVCIISALIALVRGVLGGRQRRGGSPDVVTDAATDGSGSTAHGVEASRAHRLTLRTVGAPKGVVELWRLDDMLLIATVGSAASFMALAITDDRQYSRYLTAGVIFSAILSGRMVARVWPRLTSTLVSRTLSVLGVAVTLAFLAGTGYTIAQADPVQTDTQVGTWLEGHHLASGVGDYWSASITTVETSGKVTIRPVALGPGGVISRYMRESAASWYQGQKFQFFIYNTAQPWGSDNTATATNTWGAPVQTFAVGTYRVLVWNSPIVVSP